MKPPRYSAVELLAALVLLFATAPFIEGLPHGDLVEAMLLTLVMVSAVVAVGGLPDRVVFILHSSFCLACGMG